MKHDLQKCLQKHPQICFQKRWEISADTMYRLGKCEAIVNALSMMPLSPEVRQEMLRVSLVKGAMATTAIEGNTLSEEEVAAIQRGESNLPQSRKYLETEVGNVLAALNAIKGEVVRGGAIAPVSPDLIRSFNERIGRGLGDNFESVPGEFRSHEVVVGTYRPPDHIFVRELVSEMCAWLRTEFGFSRDERPGFARNVIEAIVAHVYLVWIHPFGDGNGRTARMLEFYILLRGGFLDICSHILSNHYNETRSEYYRQLSGAGKSCDLTKFIDYAVVGLLDGLEGVLAKAQRHLLAACWRNYVYARMDAEPRVTKPTRKRYLVLLTRLPLFRDFTAAEMANATPEIAATYAKSGAGALQRDVKRLLSLGLLAEADGRIALNASALLASLPQKRAFEGGAESAVGLDKPAEGMV